MARCAQGLSGAGGAPFRATPGPPRNSIPSQHSPGSLPPPMPVGVKETHETRAQRAGDGGIGITGLGEVFELLELCREGFTLSHFNLEFGLEIRSIRPPVDKGVDFGSLRERSRPGGFYLPVTSPFGETGDRGLGSCAPPRPEAKSRGGGCPVAEKAYGEACGTFPSGCGCGSGGFSCGVAQGVVPLDDSESCPEFPVAAGLWILAAAATSFAMACAAETERARVSTAPCEGDKEERGTSCRLFLLGQSLAGRGDLSSGPSSHDKEEPGRRGGLGGFGGKLTGARDWGERKSCRTASSSSEAVSET